MMIETHPMRSKIVEMIGDTKKRWSDRAIASAVTPPVSYATVSRFRKKILISATAGMRGRSDKSQHLMDLASIQSGTATNGDIVAQQRVKLQQDLRKIAERRSSWLDDAEKRPIIDKTTGLPMVDSEGKTLYLLEHRALAAHDRNMLSALELEAKLSGALQPEQTNVTVQAVIVMPVGSAAPAETQPGAIPAPARQVVDISESVEIDASR